MPRISQTIDLPIHSCSPISICFTRLLASPLGEPLEMTIPTAGCRSGTLLGLLIKSNSKKFSVAMTKKLFRSDATDRRGEISRILARHRIDPICEMEFG